MSYKLTCEGCGFVVNELIYNEGAALCRACIQHVNDDKERMASRRMKELCETFTTYDEEAREETL